jgi:hypothetical protein
MTRIIRIEKCSRCPNVDHAGAFGRVACIPTCKAAPPGHRELPHTVVIGFANRPQAAPTDIIPDWCPLEELK